MVNHRFYSSIFYVLFLGFLVSCDRSVKLDTNTSFGYESLSDSYNSKTTIFERRYSDDTITIKIILSEMERKKILQTFLENTFQSFPPEIDCSQWGSNPKIYDRLFLENFPVVYIHNNYDRWYCPNGKKFNKINTVIQRIILNKPEIKKLESSDISYE